ncbi:MAG TPA: hypothetical protein VGF55_29470 [Gemmataceae bacterium]|jgi:hypothetical protein
MPDHPIDSDLAALTAALGGLAPAPPALDRDRLLYEAGRRSARRRPWAWPAVAGVFAVLSAGLGVRLATAPAPPPRVEIVYLPRTETPSRDVQHVSETSPVRDVFLPRPGGGYLHLRDQVVRFGADSLPAAVSGRAPAPPPVERMLGLPFGTLDDAQKSRWQHQLSRGDV